MDFKTCTKCGIPKPLEEFRVDKRHSTGRGSWCRPCQALGDKLYRKANPEKVRTKDAAYTKANLENLRAKGRAYRKAHPERVRTQDKAYKKANRDEICAKSRAYKKANLKKVHAQALAWRKANPEKMRLQILRSSKKKRSTPRGKLNDNISSAIRKALHDTKAGRHWEGLVGFALAKLIRHLEKQFTKGMSWDRYMKGEIQIDHKVPIAAFHFETPEDIDFKNCWSLKNLRPMWALENIKKGAKLERPFQPSLLMKLLVPPEKKVAA